MKHLKIAFGLAVVAGLMAVAAVPAMALGPRWVTCVPKVGGKWMAGCAKAGSTWETQELKETLEVTSHGALELEDSEPKLGTKVRVECEGTGLGTVGAEGQDSVTRITATNCRFLNKEHGECEEVAGVTASPRNLPWSTHLEERNNSKGVTELRDLIRSLTTKPPGWAVECTVKTFFKVLDECTGGTNTSVRAIRATEEVENEFGPAGSQTAEEPANCTEGKKTGTGFVRGKVFNLTKAAKGSLETRPVWPLAAVLGT